MPRIRVISCLILALIALAPPAFAGPGLHLGMTLDPDDFLVGLHWNSGTLAQSIAVVPSVEAGFGDVTMVAGNLDGHYNFKTSSELAPYIGGGFTVNWFDTEGDSEVDIGGSILGGISLSEKLFFEAKAGLGDVPDWKFYVGWHMN
ncbi:MAG TPA: hypothetical protein VFQ05_04250 [Candidatus Eisenbacteria bacterium]|nr:hypothetical protein [Candidatus Eisenbacteria bacterium]